MRKLHTILVSFLFVIVISCGVVGCGSKTTNPKQELRNELEKRVSMSFDSTVRNDKTGNYRLAKYASKSEPIQKIAAEYYKAYFEADSEIHYVINFSLNTTACVKKISDDKLDVCVYEYVDNEEHDAALIGGGMFYKEYFVTISTGEFSE